MALPGTRSGRWPPLATSGCRASTASRTSWRPPPWRQSGAPAPMTCRDGIRDFGGVPHRMEFVGRGSAESATITTPPRRRRTPRSPPWRPSRSAPVSSPSPAAPTRGWTLARWPGPWRSGPGKSSCWTARAPTGCSPPSSAAGGVVSGPFDSMEEAVAAAREAATAGDVVLLSPACASFGMFANEFERGDQFKQIVKRTWLAADERAETDSRRGPAAAAYRDHAGDLRPGDAVQRQLLPGHCLQRSEQRLRSCLLLQPPGDLGRSGQPPPCSGWPWWTTASGTSSPCPSCWVWSHCSSSF